MHRDTKDTYEQAFKTLLSIKNINGRMYEPQVFHYLLFFFFFFFFLGPRVQHMEFPRLVVESELQLAACTSATATRN